MAEEFYDLGNKHGFAEGHKQGFEEGYKMALSRLRKEFIANTPPGNHPIDCNCLASCGPDTAFGIDWDDWKRDNYRQELWWKEVLNKSLYAVEQDLSDGTSYHYSS